MRALRRSRRGFTLIEVLVVVAIVALLAAVLLPTLSRARERGRVAVCASNLRTTGHAFHYYLQANGEYMPPSGAWAERVHLYIQKLSRTRFGGAETTANGGADMAVAFYLCPSDPLRAPTSEVKRIINGSVVPTNYLVSYVMNGFCSWKLAFPELAATRKDFSLDALARGKDPLGNPIYTTLASAARFTRLSQVVLLADAGNDDLGLQTEPHWDFDDGVDPGFDGDQVLEVHHQTGNNFLYLDQHVDYSKYRVRVAPPAPGKPPPAPPADGNGAPRFPDRWIPINFK